MSNGINIPHPLKREGTYQFERFPDALNNDYIKLDERSLIDLVKQSAEYAKFVNYCNELNIPDGDWQAFFEEIYDYKNKKVKFSSIGELEANASVSPHLALFLAFLQIFNIAQENLNTLTEKHLDFYYQNILQLKLRDEVADKVVVLFETEKNTEQVKVPAGTSMPAGKDANGKNLFYVTENDLIANKATINSIKSVFIDKDSFGKIHGIYASADSPTDNAVTDNTGTTTGWLPFGSNENLNIKAKIGFAIASPILNLKEGKRRITLDLGTTNSINAAGLIAEYTSEKGWTTAEIEVNTSKANHVFLFIKIDSGLPAVLPYSEKVHLAGLNTIHPVIRFTLKNNENFIDDAYSALSTIKSSNINNIIVNVDGVKNLFLQNDLGALNNTKPFMPFGAQPVKNKSVLYIGNNDVFNKYLRSFNIAISWKGLPGRIDNYYSTYYDALNTLFPNDAINQNKYFDINAFSNFKAGHPPGNVSILDNGKWKPIQMNNGAGFKTDIRYDPSLGRHVRRADNRNIYKTDKLVDGPLTSDYSYNKLTTFDYTAKSGFVKIDLGYDFCHSKYQKLFTVAMLNMAGKYNAGHSIPEQPYTPEFNSLHIEYSASAKIDYIENQVFHICPFGNEKLIKADTLIPVFNDEGKLLIGLGNIKNPEVVSLYFCMENDSGNFDKIISDINKPHWSYLANDEWTPFADSDVVKDSTQKFSGSGIIQFNLNSDAISKHTVLPDNLVWIKAAVPQDSDAFPAIDSIFTQAVEAVFDNRGNETSHLETGIAANTISKTDKKITGIKKIIQPYNSFGGRAKEQSHDFYTRISERLHHKNRSWNIWDYERMILQNFPSLLKVKCISHTDPQYEYSPGNVYIILLPNINKIKQKNILQPRVSKSLIEEVNELISEFTSPFANINVNCAEYNFLRITCDVKLTSGFSDKTYYANQLNEDLKSFIAPWIVDSNFIPSFDGIIYKSQIINFIEERPYIDYVINFDVTKNSKPCDEAISGSKENFILTSSDKHNISTQ